MKEIKCKTFTIAIIVLLTFSMITATSLQLIASAHTPPLTIPTYCYVNTAPNLIGVGQTISITFWIDKVPPTAEGPFGDRWHGMTLTVTKPDGTTQTLGPYDSDPTGGTVGITYVPVETGKYTFVGNFPQQIADNANPYPYYEPSNTVATYRQFVNDTYLS